MKQTKKCFYCGRPANRFNEIRRKSGGGGEIIDLCDSCMPKLIRDNRQNRI